MWVLLAYAWSKCRSLDMWKSSQWVLSLRTWFSFKSLKCKSHYESDLKLQSVATPPCRRTGDDPFQVKGQLELNEGAVTEVECTPASAKHGWAYSGCVCVIFPTIREQRHKLYTEGLKSWIHSKIEIFSVLNDNRSVEFAEIALIDLNITLLVLTPACIHYVKQILADDAPILSKEPTQHTVDLKAGSCRVMWSIRDPSALTVMMLNEILSLMSMTRHECPMSFPLVSLHPIHAGSWTLSGKNCCQWPAGKSCEWPGQSQRGKEIISKWWRCPCVQESQDRPPLTPILSRGQADKVQSFILSVKFCFCWHGTLCFNPSDWALKESLSLQSCKMISISLNHS